MLHHSNAPPSSGPTPSVISTRSIIRSDAAPSALLAPLNELLSDLLIPIQLPSLALATPSLLLTTLEAVLETRFETVPERVRGSWERKDRTTVVEFLLSTLHEQHEDCGRNTRETVEVKDIVRGREKAVAFLVEDILSVAKWRGAATLPDGSDALDGHPAPSTMGKDSVYSEFSTPTPIPFSFSPATTPRPPNRPQRSSSSLSAISIRSFLTSPSPVPETSPPRTPRSTIHLMSLAGRLPTPPPPPALPGRPRAGRRQFATFDQDPFLERPRTINNRTSPKASSLDLLASVGQSSHVASLTVDFPSTSQSEGGSLKSRNVVKGKGKEVVSESDVEVGECHCDEEEHAEGVLCSCAEEEGDTTAKASPIAGPDVEAHHRRKPRQRDRFPTQRPLKTPSFSNDTPRPRTSSRIAEWSRPPAARRHTRTQSTPSLPTSSPEKLSSNPNPSHFKSPTLSTPTGTSAPARKRLTSGYLPLIGDSEVDNFERARYPPLPRHSSENSASVVKLEPPDGWSWISISKKAGRPIEPPPTSSIEKSRIENRSSTHETSDESPYTSMLLKQRDKLMGRLKELKLESLESAKEVEEQQVRDRSQEQLRDIGQRGFVRRKVKRLSPDSL